MIFFKDASQTSLKRIISFELAELVEILAIVRAITPPSGGKPIEVNAIEPTKPIPAYKIF